MNQQMAKKKNLLITGATGYIGRQFLNELDFSSYHVSCLVRDASSSAVKELQLAYPAITFISGDITKPNSLTHIPKKSEYLLHIAALTNAPKNIDQTWPLFKQINVDGTSNIIRAMPASFKQCIFVSSVDAAGSLQPLVNADEDILPQPNTEYDTSKLAAEKVVKQLASEKGFAYTIIRPSMVFGPGKSNPEMFKINTLISLYFKLVKIGLFPMFGWGNNYVPLVAVADVVKILMASIGNKKVRNQTINAVSSQPIRFKELISKIKTIANPRCLVLPIPLFILKPSLRLLELLTKPVGVTLPITAKGVTYLTTSRSYDSTKAKQLLNYSSTPLSETLQQTYRWLQQSK